MFENRFNFSDCSSVIFGRHSIVIPKFREFPDLINRECFATRQLICRAPALDCLFRPKEENRRSGENQVIVPAAKRHKKMRTLIVAHDLIILYT